MAGGTLLASAIVALPLSLAFLVVAGKLHRRSRLEHRPGLTWFSVFWMGVGTYGYVEAGWTILHLAGVSTLPIALFVLHVKIVSMTAAFAGLVIYLLAIHGADQRIRTGIVGAYGGILALTETYYSWRRPMGVEAGTWGMRIVYEVQATEPWWTLLLLVLFLPPFLATISYAMLLRHTREPEIRYRIALTSASLFLFFAPLFIGWRAGGFPWWGAVEKALAALMVLGIVLALWPPSGVKERLEGRPPIPDRALLERAHELI